MRTWLAALVVGSSTALALAILLTALAVAPANPHFERAWARTDLPVASGQAGRTWMWAPEAFTGELQEPYSESPSGQRAVQYFDKARMEITHPDGGDPSSIWYVTNGLLVVELISGRLQLGDAEFEPRQPAAVNVAGDADDPDGPTYAGFGGLLDAPPLPFDQPIIQRIDRAGNVTQDDSLSAYGVEVGMVDDVTGHAIAAPFWDFMNATGVVWEGGAYVEARLFENSYFGTGRPVTEAYWAQVKVAGTAQLVLLQCFERRCLTYTPQNAPAWQVEAGNVGQHYYHWRYEGIPNEGTGSPTATASATQAPTSTGSATSTSTPTPTMTDTPTATPEPATDYQYVSQIAVWDDGSGAQLDRPRGLEFDCCAQEASVYVADTYHHRIVKFTPDGAYVTQWGGLGSGTGQFNYPSDVATDSDGNVYVADTDNHRIQVFAPDGTFLRQWGGLGSGNGQLNSPWAVAIRYQGQEVFVADAFNHRIQVFSLQGAYLRQWGTFGVGSGQLSFPYGIDVVDAGVYVIESGNNRVQRFLSSGQYTGQWGHQGSSPGQFNGATAIVATSQYIYVADTGNHRIQKFDSNGGFLGQWGGQGSADGQFSYPYGIAIGFNLSLLVSDSFTNRVQRFSGAGNHEDTWRGGSGRFLEPLGMSVSDDGNLYVIDRKDHRVEQFDDSAQFVRAWGGSGYGNGQFRFPRDVAVAPNGDVYAVDTDNDRIEWFSSDGNYLGQWSYGDIWVDDIDIDDQGNVYVLDGDNDRVLKYSADGDLLDDWESGFNGPMGIAVHADAVYVTDGNDEVQVFNTNGTFQGQWGGSGSGAGQFDEPVGIDVDQYGFVYVVDGGNDRIQKFTPDGEYIAQWGSTGSGPGQFNDPWGIVVTDDGDVYVSDTGNYRVQTFEPVN